MSFDEHRVAVDPFARDVGLDRDARPLLDDVAADDAGVVRGAGRDDDDAAQIAHLELGQAERVEHELVAADAVADRLAHCLRLLVDLLEHERLVAALLGGLVVPVELFDCGMIDLRAVAEEPRTGRRDLDDLAVVREDRAARLREKRCNVRREEVLALAETDDERRLLPHAHEQVRLVVVNRDDREVALELRVDARERLHEITVVLVLEQVHDDLRIGLGGELMALGDQALAQLAVVLDDAVEHDRELALVAARQRVRVQLGDAAVRCPARVTEAVPRSRAVRARSVDEILEVADGAHVVEAGRLRAARCRRSRTRGIRAAGARRATAAWPPSSPRIR